VSKGSTMILKDRVAIVTGGTSGIGEALVRRFKAEGAHVVFNGRRRLLGDQIAAETAATYIQADVTNLDDVVRTVLRAPNTIDILVNAAGVSFPYAGILDVDPNDFTRHFHLHVAAAVSHIHYALPKMPRGSSIINIASTAGYRGFGDGRVQYAVSKAALISLTHHLAPELKSFGVRLNSVSPGHADIGSVIDAIMFLATDASRGCTGVDLVVDNGLICGPTYTGQR